MDVASNAADREYIEVDSSADETESIDVVSNAGENKYTDVDSKEEWLTMEERVLQEPVYWYTPQDDDEDAE